MQFDLLKVVNVLEKEPRIRIKKKETAKRWNDE